MNKDVSLSDSKRCKANDSAQMSVVPVYNEVRLNSSMFGRFNMSMNIVGVPNNDVHLRIITFMITLGLGLYW